MINDARRIVRLFDITRSRWVLLVTLAIAAGAAELLGALMIFVLLSAITTPTAATQLPFVGGIAQRFPEVPRDEFLLWVATAVAVFYVARAVLLLGQTYVQNRVAHGAGVRLSAKLLSVYVRMPYDLHIQRNSSELIRNAYSSVTQLVTFAFAPLVMIASESVLVLGIVSALVLSSAAGTGIAVAVVAPVFVVLYRTMRMGMQRLGDVNQRTSKVSLQVLQETLNNLRDIRILGKELYFERRFFAAREQLSRALYLRGTLIDVPRVLTETLLVAFILLFLVVTIRFGDGDIQQALAILGLFAYAGIRLLPSLSRIVGNLNNLQYAKPAIDDITSELDRLPRDASNQDSEEVRPLDFQEEIQVQDLSFRFDGSDADVLNGINLSIERGASVGIVGPTGAGKSTLIDVIMALLEPTGGAVLVDGSPVHDSPRRWFASLGVVPQSPFLLDDSLRRNVALGVPDDEIDESALNEALAVAQVEEFVRLLPEGLDTVLGERGVRLSGGQQQRVAIARALYRRPAVLVLDEATAALDTVTEANIMSSLLGVGGSRTTIMVAHRLSTVSKCDCIFVLEAGRLVDCGTFEELLDRSQLFRDLAR